MAKVVEGGWGRYLEEQGGGYMRWGQGGYMREEGVFFKLVGG